MIDLYCERVDPGLWDEPLNALTNLGFLVAALASWQLARRSGAVDGSVAMLIALMATVGIGSTLFHIFATRWAWFLDLLPMLVFQLWFLWLYLRRVASWRPTFTTAAVAALLLSAVVASQFPDILNRSLIYVPALLILWILGAYHARTGKREPFVLLIAGGVFTLSLLFRTIDEPACPSIPLGTHFLWHVLNPVVMYLAFSSLLTNWPRPSAGIASSRWNRDSE